MIRFLKYMFHLYAKGKNWINFYLRKFFYFIFSNKFICNNVTVLKNSRIGDNMIVATGAVVSRIYSSEIIIGGIPTKIIRKF